MGSLERIGLVLACLAICEAMVCGLARAAVSVGPPVAAGMPSSDNTPVEDKCPAETAAAAGPPAVVAAALVRRLGDPAFSVREATESRIRSLGIAARDEIVLGLRSPDVEVRRRCRRLLQAVVAADFQERLEAFKADKTGQHDHRLPGWDRFRRLLGSDSGARELFVKVFQAEPGLLASSEFDKATAAEAFEARLAQLQAARSYPFAGQPREPSLGSTAAMFLLASDPDRPLPDQIQQFVRNVAYSGEFQQAIRGESARPLVRKLFGAWIAAPTGDGLRMSKLNDAMVFDIKEAVPMAAEVLVPQGPGATVGAGQKHWAIEAVARLGGKPWAALLTPLLNDSTDCLSTSINNRQVTIQVRDVALAWLIDVTGQDHKDYGMPEAGKFIAELRKNPQQGLLCNTPHCYPGNAAQRDAALKKWQAWAAVHPLPKPPPLPKRAPPSLPAIKVPRAEDAESRGDLPGLALADRLQVQRLALARELIGQKRFAEATRALGEIVAAHADCWFQPDHRVPTYRLLRGEAEALLGQLPAEGLEAYELQFGRYAEDQLAAATKAGDFQAVAEVARGFFHTKAGAEAAYLLGCRHLDTALFPNAALQFERLRTRSRYAERYEPALSVQLAFCWLRQGMAVRAADALRGLQSREPRAVLKVAGQDRPLFGGPEEPLAWLQRLAGNRPAAPDGWLMFRGNPQRNAVLERTTPWLRPEPMASVTEDPTLAKTIDDQRQQDRKRHLAWLPSVHPLVAGETLVFRTATHLRAIDLATRKLRWEAPLEDTLWRMLRTAPTEQKQKRTDFLARSFRRRLLEDVSYGTLSSDGRRVFVVEDCSLPPVDGYQQMTVTPDGRACLDTGWLRRHNRLAAFDLQSGKLVWETEPPEDPRDLTGGARVSTSAGPFYLGPPLPLGDQLFVVADVGEESRLQQIDASRGVVERQWLLAFRDPAPNAGEQRLLFNPGLVMNAPVSSAGLSPSHVDGLIVCQTADDHVAAVDLTANAVRWVYKTQREVPGAMLRNMFGIQARRFAAEAVTSRWSDPSLTIADGCVLLTPSDSDKLICLTLADGRMRWSAPRHDGLYVAGVAAGKVIVVGRTGVRAWNLADGAPGWPLPEVTFPGGAVPSGRGYLDAGRCHVPLSTAELCAIDVQRGCILSRSRSADGTILGNLVACGGRVYSQGIEQLSQIPTVERRQAELAAAIQNRPGDAALLAERGELLLASGQLLQAAQLLRRSLESQPAPRVRELLLQTLADGLQSDLPAFEKLLAECDPLLGSPQDRLPLWQQLSLANRRRGNLGRAFDTLLKIADLSPDPAIVQTESAARTVRRDRWIRAALAELRAQATPEQQQAMDRQVAARLNDCLNARALPLPQGEKATDTSSPRGDRLEAFLAWFDWHPLAAEARLRHAARLAAQGQIAAADLLLIRTCGEGSQPQQRAAMAQRAAMLASAGRVEEAAACYRYLATAWANAVCLNGKRGRELLDDLPADSPVRKSLAMRSPWPSGKARVQVEKRQNGATPYRHAIGAASEDARWGVGVFTELDQSQGKLRAYDPFGQMRWQLEMRELSVGGLPVESWIIGQVWIAWSQNNVCAVDTRRDGGKLLWSQRIMPADNGSFGGVFPRRRWQRMQMFGQQGPVLPAALTGHAAATAGYVCFERERQLTAVDPLTGQTLWHRDDIPGGSDLFGDDEYVFVTPPDATEAIVLSAIDGREVARRTVPNGDHRAAVVGREVVTWTTNQAGQLASFNVWTGKTAWSLAFHAKAQPWPVSPGEMAVLEPSGRFTVVDLRSGKPVLDAQTTPVEDLESIAVLPQPDRYVLIASRPAKSNPGMMMFRQFTPGQQDVNGRVSAIDRRTGKTLWSTEVANQWLRSGQPPCLPVLCMLKQFQTPVPIAGQPGSFQWKPPQTHLTCLDLQSGRALHEETYQDHDQNFTWTATPQPRRFEMQSRQKTLRITWPN